MIEYKKLNTISTVHAHWIPQYLGYSTYCYKCSACGSLFGEDMIIDFKHNQYCSDCGAKMDEKEMKV